MDNDFTKKYVTDKLHAKIIDELRTNPDGTKKNDSGRKRGLTPEILRHYLFMLSMTGEYEIAAESAGLPEKRRQKYMTESETFRGVSTLAKNNISLRAKMTVAEAIMGRKPSYYQLIHPTTKQPTYIELKGIQPDVKAAMWWLETIDKVGKEEPNEEDPYNNPPLGAPRNEHEAELLEGLLNKHYDYIKRKEQLARQQNP